jgi:hypothetical protein
MSVTGVLGGLGALVVVALAGAFLLPKKLHFSRTLTSQASAESIMALVGSNSGYQQFNPYRDTDPNLKIDLFGPVAGVGSGFAFEGKDGKGTQTVAALDATSVVYDIDLGFLGRPEQRIELVQQDAGVLMTWSMTMDFGYNPVFRIFGLFMESMMGPIVERGLTKLDQAAKT